MAGKRPARAGYLPLPVQLINEARLTDLQNCVVVPSESGTHLYMYKAGGYQAGHYPLGVSDATIIAAAVLDSHYTNDSNTTLSAGSAAAGVGGASAATACDAAIAVCDATGMYQAAAADRSDLHGWAAVVFDMASVQDVLPSSSSSSSTVSSTKALYQCRVRCKCLHHLLQQQLLQLQVIHTEPCLQQQGQEQQQVQQLQQQQQQQEQERLLLQQQQQLPQQTSVTSDRDHYTPNVAAASIPVASPAKASSTVSPAAAAAAAMAAATGGGAAKGKRIRRPAANLPVSLTAYGAVNCSGWAIVSMVLQPQLFYDPLQVSSSSSKGRTAAAAALWSQVPDAPASCNQVACEGLAKAINCLMAILHDMDAFLRQRNRLLSQQRQWLSHHHHQQQQQQQQQQQASQADDALCSYADASNQLKISGLPGIADSDIEPDQDIEYAQVLQHSQQIAAAATTVGSSTSHLADDLRERYDAQYDLYSCPETAAAAATDIRQSLFDWVNPTAAWKLERPDPPGLTCQLFRYQRRALAWMLWREEHGQEPLGFWSGGSKSSDGSSGSSDSSVKDRDGQRQGIRNSRSVLESQCILGSQLLNPLWQEVKVNIAPVASLQQQQQQWGQQAATVAAAPVSRACCCAPKGHKQLKFWQDRQQQQQQQQQQSDARAGCAAACSWRQEQQWQGQQMLTLYHAVSQGLVSLQRPAGFCGPAGGVLCDEMGLGKTVEVLSLLLAHPPPRQLLGTKGASAAAASATSEDSNQHASCSDASAASALTRLSAPLQHQEHHKRVSLQPGSNNSSSNSGNSNSAGSQSNDSWPAAGKWAGPSLIVVTAAILQQWVLEISKRSTGIKVEVYEGLKWQRAEAEKELRKSQGRMNRAARKAAAATELYAYMANGPPDEPLFDAEAEASAAVKQLLRGDVVLTTYDVLQQEVHFSGDNADRILSLRHKKRYKVPTSPLLQVDWWRVAFDEAQMVGGGFTGAAVMAMHLTAKHRWAVTGTPIGPGGLEDVGSMLRLIGAAPFDSPSVFHRAISRPFAASVAAATAALQCQQQQRLSRPEIDHIAEGPASADVTDKSVAASVTRDLTYWTCQYGHSERDGVRRLLALLQPLMWRSCKETAALDHPLPPRRLQRALLRFSPAEQSFYDHILEKTAAARKELQDKQQQQQQQQSGELGSSSSTAIVPVRRQQHRRGKQGLGSSLGIEGQLAALAAGQLLQLRLACLHPQLTSYWRDLSSELQLRQGGALSISEILGRMKDGAQLKLQAAERELCVALNALASKYTAAADEATAAAAASGGKDTLAAGKGAASPGKSHGERKRARAGGKGSVDLEQQPGTVAAAAAGDGFGQQLEQDAAGAASNNRKRAGSSTNKPAKRVRFAAAENDTDSDFEPEADAVHAAPTASGSNAAASGSNAAGSSSVGGSKRRRSSTGEGESPTELRGNALKLLEDSHKVAEHGIAAILSGDSSSSNAPEPLGDIAGGDATWRAWKHVGLHTAQTLSSLCSAMDMPLKSELFAQDVTRKRQELLETATAEVIKADSKLVKLQSKVAELESELASSWLTAVAAGVPLQAMTGADHPSAWLAYLTTKLSEAKATEQAARQQITDQQGVTITTVLLGEHVPKLLQNLEESAAADRSLLEGIVGQVHARKVVGLLYVLLQQIGSGGSAVATAAGGRVVKFADTAAAAAGVCGGGTDVGSRMKAAAGVAAATAAAGGIDDKLMQHDQDLYAPSDWAQDDSGSDVSNDDEVIEQISSIPKRHQCTVAAAEALLYGSKGKSAANPAAATWLAGSALVRTDLQQGFTQHPSAAVPAVSSSSSTAADMHRAAALAATYQFLDCLPERRVVWRLLFKGSANPDPPQQQQQLLQQQQQQQVKSKIGLAADPPVVACCTGTVHTTAAVPSALAGIVSLFAGASGVGATMCRLQTEKHVRAMLRLFKKKETAYLRAVRTAAAAADAAAQAAAASAAAAATDLQQAGAAATQTVSLIQQQQQQQQVNIPRLLQSLPLGAVAAAADAARVRAELCRAHKLLHEADLGLEVLQHNKQLVEDEANMAAAGQLPQVQALLDKSVSELKRSVTDLTKKCDDLIRHKRFLAHQAAESSSFSMLQRNKPAACAGDAGAADQDQEELECAVCKCAMSDELQVFPCGHYYCDACAQVQLSQSQPVCPYCRQRVTKTNVFRVSLAGGGAHDPEVQPPEGQEVRDIKITGVWMTKLEALLRRLILMRQQEPGAKALVFSQFSDALLLASKALDVMQVKHVSLGLGGGRDRRQAVRAATKAFIEDPGVCVFLLSLRAGSSGLTLTVATRVYLLEPSLDPAVEQQAVARLHRIGQEKEVVITRLLVQGSVEEQVLAMSEAKQALLAQAAQQHKQQQQHHRLQPHGIGHVDTAVAAAAAAAAAAADTDGATEGQGGAQEMTMAAAHAGVAEISGTEDEEMLDVLQGDHQLSGIIAPNGLGDNDLDSPRNGKTLHKRRGRSSCSTGGTGSGATGSAAAAGGEGPTTLQTAAPKRESVRQSEVVDLLQAVMQQRTK